MPTQTGNSLIGQAIYLLPGQKIKIKSELTPKNNFGYTPMTGRVVHQLDNGAYQEFTLTEGFLVEDNTVGTIEETEEDSASIYYTHNRPERNCIWFYASTGERGFVDIVTVPIHDHSSIVQGGPAYGTYYSDDEVAQ